MFQATIPIQEKAVTLSSHSDQKLSASFLMSTEGQNTRSYFSCGQTDQPSGLAGIAGPLLLNPKVQEGL